MTLDIHDISHLARKHADACFNDVELCSTREEHVRMTARANEAENLAHHLQQHLISIAASDKL